MFGHYSTLFSNRVIHLNLNTETFPSGIYLLKVNKRNTRTKCEICSKLTIKIPERRHWRLCSSVSFVNSEQVNAGWVNFYCNSKKVYFGKRRFILCFVMYEGKL